MTKLYRYFEDGLADHYRWVADSEALKNACEIIGCFANPYSEMWVRQMAIFEAGRYVGVLKDNNIAEYIKGLFKRCSQLRDGETIYLTKEEKAFIKASIEGTLYRPFYE